MKKQIIAVLLIMSMLILPSCNKEMVKADDIDVILNSMTLSDKVYQMLFVTPESLFERNGITTFIESDKEIANVKNVGGIVYFAPNIKDGNQVKEMLSATKNAFSITPFIGLDEEGGIVSRIFANEDMGYEKIPPMAEIGKTGDTQKAYEVGVTLGKTLTELGFNLDFAPVADTLINEKNFEIGSRSFGSEADLVSAMVESEVKGLSDGGVYSVLKHFPGHGSTYTDSHKGRAESDRTLDELREAEFLPFEKGIKAGADFVMISHMTLLHTGEDLPSTLSEIVITDYLKNELGFSGIVITDSFQMGAITENFTEEEAVTLAINAGVDMILMPKDVDKTHKAIMDAIESGKITEERINESVRKILTAKKEKGLI